MLDTLAGLIPSLPNVLIMGAVACAVFGAAALFEREGRLRRLTAAPVAAMPGVSLRRGGSFLERLLNLGFTDRFVPGDERERTRLKTWLTQAGYTSTRAAETYYATRVVLGLAVPFVAIFLVPILLPDLRSQAVTLALLAAVVGFMLPVVWVSRRKKRRQRQVREGLPDVLDLLLVCTEAGLGLDMAIARVADETITSHPLLSDNLRLINTEVRAGKPRVDAMRAFAERTGVPEAVSLVNLLVQSDTLGTSMAGALRVFAEDMRAHRLLKAEELAQKLSVKLSMVLVACFVPALVMAVMAPIIFSIVRTWKGLPPL